MDLSPRKYQGQWPVCTREREFPATEWSTDWFHRLSFYEFSTRFFDAYAYVIDDNVITESGHRSKDRSRRICINEVEILSFRKSLSSGDAISFRWNQRKLIMENNELECSKFAKDVEFNCCFAIVSIFFSKKIFRESSVKIHLYNKVFCQKVDIDW